MPLWKNNNKIMAAPEVINCTAAYFVSTPFLISDLDRLRRNNYSEEAEIGVFYFGSAKTCSFLF